MGWRRASDGVVRTGGPSGRPHLGRYDGHLTGSAVTFSQGILRELRGARKHASDIGSLYRLSADILLYRIMRVFPAIGQGSRVRTVRLDGASIAYRLNRGDIQSIREVWFEEAYRVPAGAAPRTVLDLGANIGLASVWLARTYGCSRVIAVEPDPDNARLASRNMEANGISGEVLRCAVGPRDETALFAKSNSSNLGSLVTRQHEVASMQVDVRAPAGLLRQVGLSAVDLCKMDIEGGEEPLLLEGDLGWLSSIRSILAEIHEEIIDGGAVIESLESVGLMHRLPPPGVTHGSWFVRAS